MPSDITLTLAIKSLSTEDIRFIFERIVVYQVSECISTPCWEWQSGCSRDGYGITTLKTRTIALHKIMYAWLVGPIEDVILGKRYVLDHLCGNRRCCAPHHLERVTQQVNVQRLFTRRLRVKGGVKSCPQGHVYTPENTSTDKYGYKTCITCRRARAAAKRKRLRETGRIEKSKSHNCSSE